MERTPLVAGNWKMFKTRAESADYCEAFLRLVDELDEVDLALCPPFTSLDLVADLVGDAGIGVWGQNAHDAPEGAFTGETSCGMLIDAGATGVLLGHSERRALFGETDEALARKLVAALATGLEPVLCIGESEAERDGNATETRLRTQLEGGAGRTRGLPGAPGDDRLRARLGHRHRPQRDAGDRAGHARVHPRASSPRATARNARRRCASSTAAPSSPTTPARCSRCPMSTVRSWAVRASTRRPSRRSRAPRSRTDAGTGRAGHPRRLRVCARRPRQRRAARRARRSSTRSGSAGRTRR